MSVARAPLRQRAAAERAEERDSRAAVAELAGLLQGLPALVYRRRLDAQQTICYASAGCEALTGYPPAALVENASASFLELVHPEDRAALASATGQALATGSAYSCTYRLRRRDPAAAGGAYHWVVDSGAAVVWEDEEALAGVIVASPGPAALPATAREQAAASAVAAERNRLARELHDTVTQSLYGVLLFADAGRRLVQAGQSAGETFDQIEDVGRKGLREMRLLLHRLRPSSLATAGLEGALAERLATVEGCLGVRYRLQVTGTLALDPAAEEALYYVALEALNNALKHSRSDAVTVRLRGGAAGAVLWVVDDGRGFDPAGALAGCGLGLKTMAERLAVLGGAVRYDAAPGAGARVAARVPCAAWRAVRAGGAPRRPGQARDRSAR